MNYENIEIIIHPIKTDISHQCIMEKIKRSHKENVSQNLYDKEQLYKFKFCEKKF